MRIKSGYIIKEVSGESVAIPYDTEYDKRGVMLALNSTGAFLWRLMQEETTPEGLALALMNEYGIDRELADKAVAGFVDGLKEEDLLITGESL